MRSHDGLLRYRLLRLHLIQLMRCDVFLRHARNVSNDDKWTKRFAVARGTSISFNSFNSFMNKTPFFFLYPCVFYTTTFLFHKHFAFALTNHYEFRLYTAALCFFSSQPPYCECECKEERVSILFPFFLC